jgi:hypothetical protein
VLLLLGVGFGLARIALGHYYGFVVGTMECLEYILYVVATVLALGYIISDVTELPTHFEPLWWLLFFVCSVITSMSSWRIFWAVNLILGIVSFSFAAIYSVGLLPQMNLYEFVLSQDTAMFRGGLLNFLYVLPLATWWYIGVECVVLLANDVTEVSPPSYYQLPPDPPVAPTNSPACSASVHLHPAHHCATDYLHLQCKQTWGG